MVDSVSEVCGLMRMRGKKPKNVWQNDVVKAEIERKKAGWQEVLGARVEFAKDRCMKIYEEEKKGSNVYISEQKRM